MTQQVEFASRVETQIEEFRTAKGEQISLDDVRSLLNGLFDSAVSEARQENQALAAELQELVDYIGRARSEMKALKPRTMAARDIPGASDELHAIVEATDEAATRIMDAADHLGEIAGDADGAIAEKLQNVSTELFEASSFQDICGQRITKVVTTLTFLEEKLVALAEAVGDQHIEEDDHSVEFGEDGLAKCEENLLHGPQLDGDGMSQDDIDALLADFD